MTHPLTVEKDCFEMDLTDPDSPTVEESQKVIGEFMTVDVGQVKRMSDPLMSIDILVFDKPITLDIFGNWNENQFHCDYVKIGSDRIYDENFLEAVEARVMENDKDRKA